MNALMPRFFLMFSCGPIPGAFLNSGPVTRCFFFYSGVFRKDRSKNSFVIINQLQRAGFVTRFY